MIEKPRELGPNDPKTNGDPAATIVTTSAGQNGSAVVHEIYVPVKTPVMVLVLVAVISGLMSLAGSYIMSLRVQELHLSINSKMDKLLELNAQAAYAKGQANGAATERNTQDLENRRDLQALPRGPKGEKGERGKPGPRGSKDENYKETEGWSLPHWLNRIFGPSDFIYAR